MLAGSSKAIEVTELVFTMAAPRLATGNSTVPEQSVKKNNMHCRAEMQRAVHPQKLLTGCSGLERAEWGFSELEWTETSCDNQHPSPLQVDISMD